MRLEVDGFELLLSSFLKLLGFMLTLLTIPAGQEFELVIRSSRGRYRNATLHRIYLG